ncbi:MAG TPA: ATP-independent periplasmic protein-refolding chaperone [Erwinia sp.]|uniref:ATP-independent periplasmic protein-refolding chaperone Spy n=1 Tax=Erwinia citreus TaxID=558 RepID=UPI000E9ED585|nr:ATP-independent periplasmic protein-refolding chaperone Spy [Erwinia sp.]HBV40711.1 ATP-independent periplasmic protein-refolding chaperone [Erwinia sp.]
MRKLTSLVVAMTLAMGAASIVHAAADNITPAPAGADKPMMHKPPRHGGPHEMFKGLNLTDAQKEQMRSIMKDAHKEMPRPSLEERRALHGIIAADSFDKAKAEAQAEKMSADGKVRALSMLETQNKMYNVLTPEQKKEFNANFEKRLTEKPHHGDQAPAAPAAE